MDINPAQGYKRATLFLRMLESFCAVTETKMDKDFLNQIDRLDELVSSTEKLDDDVLICECFCVNVADIKDVCQKSQAFDLKTVQENFNLGHGCQGCLKSIDSWVNKIF